CTTPRSRHIPTSTSTPSSSSDQLNSLLLPQPPSSTLFPYTTLFRSQAAFLRAPRPRRHDVRMPRLAQGRHLHRPGSRRAAGQQRSEEHTSELQSRENLVCRLLLEKKNKINADFLCGSRKLAAATAAE